MTDLQNISQQETNLLHKAVFIHQSGQLHEAEQIYRAILTHNPIHPDANHNMGVLAIQHGQIESALHFLEMALLTNPTHIQFAITYTNALLKCGEAGKALSFITESMLQHSSLVEAGTLRTDVQALVRANNRNSSVSLDEAHDTLPNQGEITIASLLKAIKKTVKKKTNGNENRQRNRRVSKRILRQFLISRAETLHHHSQFYALECLSRFVIKQDRTIGYPWITLGAALFQQGKPSQLECRQAVALCPQEAAAYINLGASLMRSNELDEAAIHFRHALSLNPNETEAHYNLGNCLKSVGQLKEAETHYRGALKSNAKFFSAQYNLGLVLKSLGDFEQSQGYLSDAVQSLFLTLKISTQPVQVSMATQRKKEPFHLDAAYRALDELRRRLDNAQIKWSLFAGTVLGVYRDGDLLPFDKDIDIAIHASVDRTSLISCLTKDGGFEPVYQYSTEEEYLHQYSLSIQHLKWNIGIDIFFLVQDDEDFFLAGAFHPRQALLCRISRFDFMDFLWRGELWPIPSFTERYLEEVYGAGWRQPDKGFDTVLSNPSRIAQAMPPVICYAYSRIYSSLRERDWNTSHALCRQLLLRITDTTLSELETWLSTQMNQLENCV